MTSVYAIANMMKYCDATIPDKLLPTRKTLYQGNCQSIFNFKLKERTPEMHTKHLWWQRHTIMKLLKAF